MASSSKFSPCFTVSAGLGGEHRTGCTKHYTRLPRAAGSCCLQGLLLGLVAAVPCHSQSHEWSHMAIKAEQPLVSRDAQGSTADLMLNHCIPWFIPSSGCSSLAQRTIFVPKSWPRHGHLARMEPLQHRESTALLGPACVTAFPAWCGDTAQPNVPFPAHHLLGAAEKTHICADAFRLSQETLHCCCSEV